MTIKLRYRLSSAQLHCNSWLSLLGLIWMSIGVNRFDSTNLQWWLSTLFWWSPMKREMIKFNCCKICRVHFGIVLHLHWKTSISKWTIQSHKRDFGLGRFSTYLIKLCSTNCQYYLAFYLIVYFRQNFHTFSLYCTFLWHGDF